MKGTIQINIFKSSEYVANILTGHPKKKIPNPRLMITAITEKVH